MPKVVHIKIILACTFLFLMLLVLLNFKLTSSGYLNFSDAAKYADIARNIVLKNEFSADFTFFGPHLFENSQMSGFPARGIPVFTPFLVSLIFRIAGVSDLATISVSFISYLLVLWGTYNLSKKIFNNFWVSILSVICVGVTPDFLNYALSGGTEMVFIAQSLWGFYFLTLRRSWANTVAVCLMVMMYLTRPQAFVGIAAMVMYFLLIHFKPKKAALIFFVCAVAFLIFDYLLIPLLPENIYFISVLRRGSEILTQYNPGQNFSESLRGNNSVGPLVIAFKKFFYVSYNFYKLLPQILNPYLASIFVIGLAIPVRSKLIGNFKYSAFFAIIATFIVTALSIPFFRYIHPVVPFIYIFAVYYLYQIINKFIPNGTKTATLSVVFIFLFVILQSLGSVLLDSRNLSKQKNSGKPPVYYGLSKYLKENTPEGSVIVTNLDTWGTWYGERKTVWFPLKPEQIISHSGQIPFDGIYLTNYLTDDENYSMDASWRQIYENPGSPEKWTCDGCSEISRQFYFKGETTIKEDQTFEKMEGRGILLLRK